MIRHTHLFEYIDAMVTTPPESIHGVAALQGATHTRQKRPSSPPSPPPMSFGPASRKLPIAGAAAPAGAVPSALVVNSNTRARIELRGAMHTAGFAVMACDSRAAAIKALRDRHFDLVILDVVLQDGTGIELVRLLRSLSVTASIPVILLAADGGLRERAHGLELDPDEIVQKPCTSAQVVARARRLLHIPTIEPEPLPRIETTPKARSAESWKPTPTPLPKAGEPVANAAWRNQVAVPAGSLLHQLAVESGIASVIGPTTVARACKRAGVDVSASSPLVLKKVLPTLRDTLRLFLREPETEDRIQKMAALLQAA